MNVDLEKIIKRLDFLCFVIAVSGTVPLIIFEFFSAEIFFKISIAIYLIVLFLLLVIMIFRLIGGFTEKENINLKLSNFEKIHYIFSAFLVFICIFWFIFMIINI